ncbi:MAG: SAM-dependent methyltransferase [Pacificimonas sp.]|nr:SAM-dependent methyltransferase [Pacificimonas sp.]
MSFAADLRAEISARGGLSVADYMQRCNAHYYATRDPFGADGDFTTAPEISQMFGELIGLSLADLWQRAGAPAPFTICELGPGRGTLMADLLRAAARVTGFTDAAQIILVETSPALRQRQVMAVPGARHIDTIEDLPTGPPLLLIANEFFDALPIEQQVESAEGWTERRVITADDGNLVFNPESGPIRETSPATLAIASTIAAHLAADGGAALIIDYGYAGGETGDTLQAVRRHEQVAPLAHPGDSDLTAHVDFRALAQAAASAGAKTKGPVTQAAFLSALGIGMRAEQLMAAQPGHREDIAAAVRRLTGPDQMGALFKALALHAPNWPAPAGV